MSENYFKNNLNYTLANEDTAMELAMVPLGVNHLFSIAGSGGRVLPLLAQSPRQVTLVDLSQEQLHLAELRFAAAKQLSLAEFKAFWGYPPYSQSAQERRQTFDRLALSDGARAFLSQAHAEKNWESLLYEGRWEKTFQKLSVGVRAIVGARGLLLFNALSPGEHRQTLATQFPKKLWRAVVFLLGNAGVFNALLYKGSFPKKNIPDSFFSFYESAFNRLFQQGPARKNFFLQLVFFGKIVFEDGCPVECEPEVFARAQACLRDGVKINYVQGDAIAAAKNCADPIDFVSLSDVPSYFSGDLEKNYMQRLRKNLNSGARVVVRHYLHVTEQTQKDGFRDVTGQFASAISREKLQVYITEVLERE